MDNQNKINQEVSLPIPEEAKKALIEEMGIAGMPEEQQNELLGKMTEVVIKRILLEVLEKLSEADQAAYEGMLVNNASPEEIDKFIQEKVPDYEKIVAKVVGEFKEEMKKEV